jgi:hypothetical protein
MTLRRFITISTLLLTLGPAVPGPRADDRENERAERVPVLVELFTSQGCSSCPPADEFLSRLRRVQPIQAARIIVLSQHVDYWNDLGWDDPFSSRDFSRRQGEYAERFHSGRVYTPQMVVDGQTELVGNDKAAALRAIARAADVPKSPIRVSRSASPRPGESLALDISVDRLSLPTDDDTIEILLAVTESNLSSSVSRGENAGHELRHDAVVRELRNLGVLDRDGSFSAEPRVELGETWNADELGVVVFAQERESGRIRAIGQLDLGPD